VHTLKAEFTGLVLDLYCSVHTLKAEFSGLVLYLCCSVHSLEGQVEVLRQQVHALTADLSTERLKQDQTVETLKRVNKKLLLITKVNFMTALSVQP